MIDGEGSLETPARLRRQAYLDVMKAHGQEPIVYEVEEVFDRASQEAVMQKLVDEQPELDGVFATNDLFAASFMRVMKSSKRASQTIEVVGYDGTEAVRALLPELATIQQPIEEIAKTAIDLLLKEIDGEFTDEGREIQLPVRLLQGIDA